MYLCVCADGYPQLLYLQSPLEAPKSQNRFSLKFLEIFQISLWIVLLFFLNSNSLGMVLSYFPQSPSLKARVAAGILQIFRRYNCFKFENFSTIGI